MQTHDSDSSASDAALRRGISAARAGLRSVAAAQFERAAEQSPDDPNVWLWLAWVANSPDNTTRCLDRVLELSPGHAAAITGLAWASALAHDTPLEQIVVSDAEGESGIKTESPQESPTVDNDLVCELPGADISLEVPAESIWTVAAHPPQDFAESISVAEPVDVSDEAAPDTIPERFADFPSEDSSRRRWSELVQRDPDSLTDSVAWPTYAQYPNSAAITYPTEYSASAWPYIGPFYPYPQVPLGWRSAQLDWDDGHWNLNFRSRTDKWWWFISPKNW